VSTLARLSKKSTFQVAVSAAHYLSVIKSASLLHWSHKKPNIGIIGEVYCCIDEGTNKGVLKLIESYGGNIVSDVRLTHYINPVSWWKSLWHPKTVHQKLAASYFEGQMAGHAEENLASLLKMINRGINGVVHILPLTCMPENTIEDYIDSICEESNTPLLRIPLDETSSPANIMTRVETFVKLLLRKRGQNVPRN